ncbi:MAG: threonine/serine dehydratase [Candidatus Aminicenantes bacterium]|nr:threonine/serine dehydratase [Candidatus Aminicenantes bacterium]
MNNPDYIKLSDIRKEALEAEKRIREHIRETHVEYSPFLSQSGNCNVYLKLENLQLSGSFKLRGVMNKLLSLEKKQRETELITASSGNHGAAFAYALKKLGLRGTIYMPSIANQAKIEGLRYYDTELKFHGTDCVETEVFARNAAEKNHLQYIPPYNDLKIIGGQATIGIEMQRQIENINTVLVPVGGGGLISGIAGYLKSINNNIEIIGCQPENSAVMYESIKAGKIVEMESKPTLSDASAGGIEKGTITFDICKKFVDDFILVKEEEIKEGIKLFIEKHNMLVEGTAALPAASYLKTIEKFKNKNVVLILSGARISLDQLKEVLG